MLTKKPLGPVSCLACDKQIQQVGQIADYKPWKKMPYKNQQERLTQVRTILIFKSFQYGPGFSKVLSKLKHDNTSEGSPRNDTKIIPHVSFPHGGGGSTQNLRAQIPPEELYDVLKSTSLVGIYEDNNAVGSKSPDSQTIFHFLPESIKGVDPVTAARQF